MSLSQRFDTLRQLWECFGVISGTGDQRQGNNVGDLLERVRTKAAGGQRRGTNPQTRCGHWWSRIPWDSIAVDGDINFLQEVLALVAIEVRVPQVNEDQGDRRATGWDPKSTRREY